MNRGRFEIRTKWKFDSDTGLDKKYWWWVYLSANNKTVCQSEMLESEQAARKGIAAVKRGVFNPVVVK